jgi:GMP synthase-like glutamine amidotransferase
VPARLGEWLRERELPFLVHRVWHEPVPDPTDFAFVVSLGSDESVSATEPAWIPAEIAALRRAVDADVPVLGICFGGQALSVALGGGSERLPAPEIGWLPVQSMDPGVPAGPWLHWHSEQLQLPPGARALARSPAGVAAFRRGPHLGVQFHPEVDARLVRTWARNDAALAGHGITREQLAVQTAAYAAGARAQAFALFDGWSAHRQRR